MTDPIYLSLFFLYYENTTPSTFSSVGSVEDLGIGACRFEPLARPILFPRMTVIVPGFIPLSTLSNVFDDGYVGKQPVPLKKYCAEHWLNKL